MGIPPLLQDIKAVSNQDDRRLASVVGLFWPRERVWLNLAIFVTPMRFELMISWMRTKCPGPLDDGAVF